MIGLIIMILISALIAGSIEQELHDTFTDPDWMEIENL